MQRWIFCYLVQKINSTLPHYHNKANIFWLMCNEVWSMLLPVINCREITVCILWSLGLHTQDLFGYYRMLFYMNNTFWRVSALMSRACSSSRIRHSSFSISSFLSWTSRWSCSLHNNSSLHLSVFSFRWLSSFSTCKKLHKKITWFPSLVSIF